MLHGLPRGGPHRRRARERELTRGLELVTVLADRDQPVRAGRRQIRVTAVAASASTTPIVWSGRPVTSCRFRAAASAALIMGVNAAMSLAD
jgi:hypothetical protein